LKVDLNRLDRGFNAECVVVVGDSRRANFEWLRGQSTFQGKLYSVQVNPETIREITALGVENYTSLLDIPEPVDLAIIATPREAALRILEDCIRKEVAVTHFYTAGFSETNSEEGIRLERLLVQRAEEANLHLIGPNCVGIFNPRIGIRQSSEQYTGGDGAVGFISQSGSIALNFSIEAHLQGVDICKSVSIGNGIVLDAADYLEYFGCDPAVRVIGMYLEGVRKGKRFFQVLREVAARKPVVVWKGGRTDAGERAISSHTGSLAIAQSVWDAAMRQCGAVRVTGRDELIDTLKALLYLPPAYGDRVAIAGVSGGDSVTTADEFSEAGLNLPPLTQTSIKELDTFFNLVGAGYSNPIDTANPNRMQMKHIMDILERDANIDNLVMMISTKPGMHPFPEMIENDIQLLDGLSKATVKPVMTIVYFSNPDATKEAREVITKCQENGIPAFPSIARAAHALKNTLTYYRNIRPPELRHRRVPRDKDAAFAGEGTEA